MKKIGYTKSIWLVFFWVLAEFSSADVRFFLGMSPGRRGA